MGAVMMNDEFITYFLNFTGPPVNSEFYTTWYTWWSNSKEVVQNMEGVRQTMDWMWKAGASFSFYMIHG